MLLFMRTMKIVNRKTRKAIEKTLRKAIKKHGPALAAGLASGIASSLATLASTDAPDNSGKSNLKRLAEKVQGAFKDDVGKNTRKRRDEKKSQDEESQHMHSGPAA